MFQSVIPIVGSYGVAAAGPYSRLFIPSGETVHVFSPIWRKDDFLGDLILDEWNVCLGSDAQAAGAISVGIRGGVARLTSGNNSGTASDDIAMLNSGLNFLAAQGGVGLEVRLRMNTAVTGGTMGVGFTDVQSATGSTEEPSSISGTTQTTTATDGAGLLYDTAQTTDQWYSWAVKNDTDTASTISGVAPVADTYQILRVEIDASGALTTFINDVQVHSVAAAITTTALLTPYVYVNATTTASVVVDIDYAAVWSGR